MLTAEDWQGTFSTIESPSYRLAKVAESDGKFAYDVQMAWHVQIQLVIKTIVYQDIYSFRIESQVAGAGSGTF